MTDTPQVGQHLEIAGPGDVSHKADEKPPSVNQENQVSNLHRSGLDLLRMRWNDV